MVSHGSAAAYWGLRDEWPELIDITVPVEAGRKIDGVRCRRCRYPGEDEIAIPEGFAVTTPARTLVDEAGLLGVRPLRREVERAAMLKLLDLDALYVSIAEAKGRRGLKVLRAIAGDWETPDGTTPELRSEFEALVLPRLLSAGLHRPACNQPLRINGERIVVDFLWEGRKLVVETDGAQTHATPVAFQRDRWRDQLLVAAGYRVARITWDQMKREPDSVVARVANALKSPP